MTYSAVFSSGESFYPGRVAKVERLSTGTTEEPSTHQKKCFSLLSLWAKNYVRLVASADSADTGAVSQEKAIAAEPTRHRIAERLTTHLTRASAQAWTATDQLLGEELQRHGIAPDLVNPWEIAADAHTLYQKVLHAYAQKVLPYQVSVLVSGDFGRIRQKYTQSDPRVLGFVSMQFHYTGKMLLSGLSKAEQAQIEPYFKVMDDHLYMPLRAAYDAAAQLDYDSPKIQAVRHLLPISTQIAQTVCRRVSKLHTGYQSYSGMLTAPAVQVSSIRDVEMFQIYLCLCVLEDSVQSLQRELFPLCVMLYPRLQVSWRLVQDMVKNLSWEMQARLQSEDAAIFLPYLYALNEMFSSEVFS